MHQRKQEDQKSIMNQIINPFPTGCAIAENKNFIAMRQRNYQQHADKPQTH